MKTFITTFLFLLSTNLINAQIFVNHAATGNDDGTSWQDAYTNLKTAIDNSSLHDEIWIAAGTYVPNSSSFLLPRTFEISHDLKLYGGFNGTETTRNQRDATTNLTILSGDVNGDDVLDDFFNSREDNVLNVMYIKAVVTSATVIDGLTIKNGQADGDGNTLTEVRGAAIFSLGAPQIKNCRFVQNYASMEGASVFFCEQSAREGIVMNCVFEKNNTLGNGAGLAAANIGGKGITIYNCEFLENQAALVGGAVFFLDANGTILNSTFRNNQGNLGGGAIEIDNPFYTSKKHVIENCVFENNVSSYGGALRFLTSQRDSEIEIAACDFISNRVEFLDAVAPFPHGGAVYMAYYGQAGNMNSSIEDCLFLNNSSTYSSGAVAINGYDNNFSGNEYTVHNCHFEGNTASDVGGLYGVSNDEDYKATVTNSTFKNNLGESTASALAFSNTSWNALEQEVKVSNCLFTNHNNFDATSVISFQNFKAKLLHCTLADSDIVGLQILDAGEVYLQNNIIHTAGQNSLKTFPIEGSNSHPTFISLGGNLLSDGKLHDWGTTIGDQQAADPFFEEGTYQLLDSSPAIDMGVLPDEMPEFDLMGNARVQGNCIDIGALESVFIVGDEPCLTNSTTGTETVLVDNSMLKLAPNPTADFLQISLENDWQGKLHLQIINALGQVVQTTFLEKSQLTNSFEMNVEHLSKGIYRLSISDGMEMVVQSFVKI